MGGRWTRHFLRSRLTASQSVPISQTRWGPFLREGLRRPGPSSRECLSAPGLALSRQFCHLPLTFVMPGRSSWGSAALAPDPALALSTTFTEPSDIVPALGRSSVGSATHAPGPANLRHGLLLGVTVASEVRSRARSASPRSHASGLASTYGSCSAASPNREIGCSRGASYAERNHSAHQRTNPRYGPRVSGVRPTDIHHQRRLLTAHHSSGLGLGTHGWAVL